ncbi:MAG: ribonuclease III [Pseudomonadales bacterium]|nr:ribonuclease III [Pseudomonadales bacterium]
MARLNRLEDRLGYQFQQQNLLTQAVTHRSFSEANNERLEFLGDSILNYLIAAALYSRFDQAAEGELSRLRARLVKQATLAEVAREIDLGDYLSMGSGELKSGGFERDSILSDAVEAIIGAIYLDGGIESASDCVYSLFASRLDNLSETDLEKDAKTRLQEHLQGIGESVPEYELLKMKGKSPNQVFEVECRAAPLKSAIRASGSSRRRAEQTAAKLALQQLVDEGQES